MLSLANFLQRFGRTAAATLVSLVGLYVLQVVLAKTLGARQYGYYSYALSWIGIAGLVAKLGLDTAIHRYVPLYLARRDWNLCRGVVALAYRLALLMSVATAIVLWVVAPALAREPSAALTGTLRAAALVVPFWVFVRLSQSIVLALKRPALSQLPEGLLIPALLISFALVYPAVVHWSLASDTAMWATLIIYGLVFALLSAILRRIVPKSVLHAAPAYRGHEWFRATLPFMVISGMHVVMSHSDILMLGMMRDTTEAGIYSAAARVAGVVLLPLMLANMVVAPYVSHAHDQSDRFELQTSLRNAMRVVCALGALLALVILSLSAWILGLFGPEFVAGRSTTGILVVAQLVNVLSGSVGMLLSMTGHATSAAGALVLGAVLNVILNLIMIPRFGMEGAAMATGISIVVWNLLLVRQVRSKLGVDPTALAAFAKLTNEKW